MILRQPFSYLPLLVGALLLAPAVVRAEETSSTLTRAQTLDVMHRAFDWQMAHLRKNPGAATDWVRGVLLTGVMASYDATRDETYRQAAENMSVANVWKPGPRLRHADDHCVGQTYAELYLLKKDPERIAALQTTFDKLMVTPPPTKQLDWWWCDALYMAPPAWVRMSAATGDPKYRDYMDANWWKTTELLYDTRAHLFARDATYLIHPDGTGKREKNGEKIFWSRGNGWVLAALVRVIAYLPDDYPSRPRYIALYREMSQRIASLQGADGLWRASLLDPNAYPRGETSGTGLFCYAMAWGINHGILDRATYEPVVQRAWKGMVGAVEPSGKLDLVQPPNGQPALVKRENTWEYGVGGLLLSGSEMLALEK